MQKQIIKVYGNKHMLSDLEYMVIWENIKEMNPELKSKD